MIASLFMGAYVIIDGAFIGSKLGDLGLSAVNIAWPITAFTQTVGLAIGIGGGIKLSIALGKNDKKEYEKIFNSTIFYLIFTSLIFTILLPLLTRQLLILSGAKDKVLEYGYRYLIVMSIGSIFQVFSGGLVPILKNKGLTKYSMLLSISACLFNTVFDYVFIYALDLDLLGAALASILGQAIIAIGALIKLKPKMMFNNLFNTDIIKSSIAPFILNYSYAVITIINNTLCLKYGSDAGVAAYTIFSYLIYIIQSSASGSGDGAQPVISYYYGLNDYKNMKDTFIKSTIIGFIFSSIIIVFFIILKNNIPVLYNLSPTSLNYYNFGFIYYISAFFILVLNRLISCFMYSSNNIKISNILTMLEPLILTPIILIILSHFYLMNGILVSYLVIQLILFIIAGSFLLLVFRRYKYHGVV